MNLNTVRREYKFAELSKRNIKSDPIHQFEIWLNEALNSKVNDPTSMSAITVGKDGFPQSRMVLLKGYSRDGFTFFTNYLSEKGKAISADPKVGLLFYWPELERQVRISGIATKSSEKDSDNYFQSRPITSRIAAVVSNQSEEIPNRSILENKFFDLQNKLQGSEPKRPESWGGYIVKPVKIEFWQGRESRLHDRILYEKKKENWIIKRLAP